MTTREHLAWLREAYIRDCITLDCFEDAAERILSGRYDAQIAAAAPHAPWPKDHVPV